MLANLAEQHATNEQNNSNEKLVQQCGRQQLPARIQLVARGERQPRNFADENCDGCGRNGHQAGRPRRSALSEYISSGEADQLTARQREILQLLAEGKTMKEIASITNLSTRTIEWHKYRMMKLLGVGRSAELIQHAVRMKLVS